MFGKITWYVPQNGSTSYLVPSAQYSRNACNTDADGDTIMGGINSIQALQSAINALNQTKEDPDDNRPRAKWRSLEEFKRLTKEAKCIRCTSKAHKSRMCPKYRAAKNLLQFHTSIAVLIRVFQKSQQISTMIVWKIVRFRGKNKPCS